MLRERRGSWLYSFTPIPADRNQKLEPLLVRGSGITAYLGVFNNMDERVEDYPSSLFARDGIIVFDALWSARCRQGRF